MSYHQEMFTKVAQHLLKQNARSVSYTESCRYRGDDGRMCAVGCLIADEAYSRDMEGLRVSSGVVIEGLRDSGVCTNTVLSLLIALQSCHDSTPVSEWRQHLREIADEYGLEMP